MMTSFFVFTCIVESKAMKRYFNCSTVKELTVVKQHNNSYEVGVQRFDGENKTFNAVIGEPEILQCDAT